MLTPEKIKATRRLVNGGVPEGEIKIQLKEEGYTDEDIKEIFRPKPADMRSWFLFFGVLFLAIGLYMLFYHKRLVLLGTGIIFIGIFLKLDTKAKKRKTGE